MLLDADIVPVQDPTFLFETRQFRECGAVFWPDDGRTSRDSLAWRVFGVDFRDEPEMESGQVLVDKRRHWQAMNLCNWYNEHSDFYYQYVYGDKDTFRFAWHRLQQPFCMPQTTVAKLPRCLVQFDFEGQPLFQHRCLDKWSLAGNRCIRGFIHESRCCALPDELRRHWRPPILTAKARDRAVQERVGGRRFTYCRVGFARWALTLGESGVICDSQATGIAYWWGEEAELVLANADGHPVCRLRPTATLSVA